MELYQQVLRVSLAQNEPKVNDASDGSVYFEVAVVAEALNLDI